VSAQEALAWEAERRRRVAYATFAAAVLTLLGTVVGTLGISGLPSYEDRALTIVDTMARTAAGAPIPPGRFALQTLWLGDHAVVPILGAVLFALGTLLIFPSLAFLFRAARARRDRMPQLGLLLAAVGAVTYAVGRFAADLGRFLGAMNFRDAADHSNSAARDALFGTTTFLAGQAILQLGALALGFAMVTICLNAMRVGLLTRFMGVLGIIVGVAIALSLAIPIDQQGIIRAFWLGALGFLVLGRWPRGDPPAWVTGEARPWPSQQQLREQRSAQRAASSPVREPSTPPTPPPAAPRPRRPDVAPTPSASAKKRKRKRRT
jgi:hypothetical protein